MLNIFSIIANIVIFIVLRLKLYTDRAVLPTGETREWHRSPIDRLYISDRPVLFYLQIIFIVVSIITNILPVLGIRNKMVRNIQIISTIASAILFIIIMIVTSNTHVKYS